MIWISPFAAGLGLAIMCPPLISPSLFPGSIIIHSSALSITIHQNLPGIIIAHRTTIILVFHPPWVSWSPSPPPHSFSTPVLHSPCKPSTPASTRLLISYILTHPYSYSRSFDFRRGLMHRSLRLCSSSLSFSLSVSVCLRTHPPCGSRLLI